MDDFKSNLSTKKLNIGMVICNGFHDWRWHIDLIPSHQYNQIILKKLLEYVHKVIGLLISVSAAEVGLDLIQSRELIGLNPRHFIF